MLHYILSVEASCLHCVVLCHLIVQTWTDYRLMWNVSEFDGLDMIFLSVNEIWTPDVMLNNK